MMNLKPPPFLLGATLLFWGWQSDLFIPGTAMALILESSLVLRTRWDFSDDDFSRVWTFCSLMMLASVVYAFTNNGGPASFGAFLQNPTPASGSTAGTSSARTVAAMFRWLPMIFFPFVIVQAFSTRDSVPLKTVSLIFRRRLKKAARAEKSLLDGVSIHVGYPYFGACLLAAAVHHSEDATFFWGLCALLAWAFWTQRSRRFRPTVWVLTLGAAVALGYFGQETIGQLQRYIEGWNPQWFSRYTKRAMDPAESKTMLGHIGNLKLSGEIVIRLDVKEGQAPQYLREASYRSYKPRAWYAGSSKDDFVDLRETPPNSGMWPLVGKSNSAIVNIACYLDNPGKESEFHSGLLPLPEGAGRLENLMESRLQKNPFGAVLAEGPGLLMFDARFGPGKSIDGPPDDADLYVPPNETPALDSILAKLQLNEPTLDEATRAIGRYFADNFTYSTWQSPPEMGGTNDTPLARFLLKTRSGHCEYFATATALLLRRAGIHTRYAVGFSVHENTSDNKYVVRLRDAHAWCLVWDKDQEIWRDFDTTPASWVKIESSRAGLQWLSDVWSRIKFEFAKFRWNQAPWKQYLVWTLVPALVVLLFRIVFRRGRRRHRKKDAVKEALADWPGRDSEFYRLEKKIAERGVQRGASESLSDWLLRVLDTPGFTELRRPLQELLRLHYRYRFDPAGLSEADRDALRNETKKCLEALSHGQTAVR